MCPNQLIPIRNPNSYIITLNDDLSPKICLWYHILSSPEFSRNHSQGKETIFSSILNIPSLENSLPLKSFLSYPSYTHTPHVTPPTPPPTHTGGSSLANLEKMKNNRFSVTSNGTELMSLTELTKKVVGHQHYSFMPDKRKLFASWVVCHIRMWN